MGPDLSTPDIRNLFWTNERQTLGLQHFLHRRRVEYPARLQDEYVFVYCLSGRISVTEAGETRVLKDGELLIGNSLRWRGSEYAAHGPCEGLTLIASPKLVPGFPVFEGKREARHLRRLVEDSLSEMSANQPGKHELLDALSREFLVRATRLFAGQERPQQAQKQRLLSRRHYVGALDYMQSCPKNEFSLDSLTHRIGMAPADFSRLFRLSTGQTPLTVYNNLLISQAEAALAGAGSVKEVVYQFGFQSPSHFAALYKKVKGHAPSEMRLSKN
jgi:AraC-like DNA-binding protein